MAGTVTPMAEYIEREWLVKEAEEILNFRKQHYFDRNRIADAVATLEWLKDYAPAADVVPVRHGRWEPYTYISCGLKKSDGFVATCCTRWNKIRERYCPNCGADMRGE